MSDSGLRGRVALVTGASRGIGRACSVRLAQDGARIAINYRNDLAGAEQTARLVREAGGEALLLQADVADPAQVSRMLDELVRQLGPVELLVNNAGIFDLADHGETTPERWQRTLDVNLNGPYHVTWGVKDEMIRRGYGRIVNVSSIAGLRPRPQCVAYAVSKAGLISLTRSLAEALARHGIRVNAVAPGLIDTEMVAGVDDEARRALLDATPLGRLGTPAEIAETIHFLLSDQSSFTTGQTLVVCGGRVTVP